MSKNNLNLEALKRPRGRPRGKVKIEKKPGRRQMKMVIEMNDITRDAIEIMSLKFGISQKKLCGMWLDLIDPENAILLEKIRDIKVKNEVKILTTTRNALMAKLYQKGVIQDIAELDSHNLHEMIIKIKEKRDKERE